MLSPTIFAQTLKKLPTPVYKWLARNWIDYEWPRHLFVELTSRCNLSCTYCPRPKVSRDIPFWLFRKIVDEASLHGKRSFSLHLFGEPLLYPKIIEAVRYLKRHGHTVVLTTNGMYLPRFWNDLKCVDKIIWSYKHLVNVPEEAKYDKRFVVRFFEGDWITKEESYKWPRIEIRPFHNYGGQCTSIARSTGNSRWPCYHPFLAPAVTASGEMVICCADPLVKSSVGNVSTMTIAEGWRRMRTIREEHKRGIFRGICADCDVWKNYPSFF